MQTFDRSGLAALSDLRSTDWRSLFGTLERRQQSFLSRESEFRSPEYRWPRDPLHQWSRVWEYPYVYHHLRSYHEGKPGNLCAVDVGSGVTFFPFAVADLGYRVVCTDVDPVCEVDIGRAIKSMPKGNGQVEGCRPTDGRTLPFADGEADAVYCISVLEHVPTWTRTVEEIARILKPGGLFVLTVDIDLLGNAELGIDAHQQLVERLMRDFDYRAAERTVHPTDVLCSDTGPYPLAFPTGLDYWLFLAKQRIKPLLGRKPITTPGGVHLACHGLALEKKMRA